MRSDTLSFALVALFTSSAIAGPIVPSQGDEAKRSIKKNLGSLIGFGRRQITTTVIADPATTCTPCASGVGGQVTTITETVTASAQAEKTITITASASSQPIQTVTVVQSANGEIQTPGTVTLTQTQASTITVVQSANGQIQSPQVITVTQTELGAGSGGSVSTVTEGKAADGIITSSAGPKIVTYTLDGSASVATISGDQTIVPITDGSTTSLATLTQGQNVVTVGQGSSQSVVTVTVPAQTTPLASLSTATAGGVITVTEAAGIQSLLTLTEGQNVVTVSSSGALQPSVITVTATRGNGNGGNGGRPTNSAVAGVFPPGSNNNNFPGRPNGNGGTSVTVNIIVIQFLCPGKTTTITTSIAGQNVTSFVSSPPFTSTTTITTTEGASQTGVPLPGVQNGTATIISNSTVVLNNTLPLTNGTNLSLNSSMPLSNITSPANLTLPIALNQTAPVLTPTNLTLPSNGTNLSLNATLPTPLNSTVFTCQEKFNRCRNGEDGGDRNQAFCAAEFSKCSDVPASGLNTTLPTPLNQTQALPSINETTSTTLPTIITSSLPLSTSAIAAPAFSAYPVAPLPSELSAIASASSVAISSAVPTSTQTAQGNVVTASSAASSLVPISSASASASTTASAQEAGVTYPAVAIPALSASGTKSACKSKSASSGLPVSSSAA